MRRILFTIALLWSFTAMAAQKGDTLKVMTYNLRFGELSTLEKIGDYIASECPDIVAL